MKLRQKRTLATVAGIVVAALSATIIPGYQLTTASWQENEWAHGQLGTTSFDCGTDVNYSTQARGKFLGGGVLGIDLDAIAALDEVTASRSGASAPTFQPAGATHVTGGANSDSYLNPLSLSALTAIGIDLSGFGLGLPIGSAGAVNQYARVSNQGVSAGASGLVNNTGGVGVTETTPDADLPEPASIQLATLLPTAAGVSDVALNIGAVASSSTLDWCSQMANTIWGDGTLDASTRDYGIASLDLAVDSPLIATLIPKVQTTIGTLNTALANLQGPTGLIAGTINSTLTGVGGVLAGLNLGSSSGTVSLSAIDLTAVNALLSGPGAILSDGVVSVDLADPNGTITVNLAELVGGPDQLNNLSPNTELIINAAVINDILTRVGNLIQGWVNDVSDALMASISAIQLAVNLTTRVGISALGIDIISVNVTLNTDLGELITPDGTPPVVGVTATALSLGLLGAAVAAVLSGLGLGSLSSIVNGINASVTLPGDLLAAITSTVVTQLVTPVTTLVTDLTAVVTQLVTALGAVLGSLPSVLSVMVNVQPDQAGAPPGVSYTAAVPPNASKEYVVSALRIGLLDGGIGSMVHLELATAAAGVNAILP